MITAPPRQDANLTCPACQGVNAPDAVFCAHPRCHKALGEFRYAIEELQAEVKWHEALASRIAGFISQPQFIAVHAIWFVFWAAVNGGVITFLGPFDAYPYNLLGIILGIEAIFITGFLLIDDSREDKRTNKLAELDYEVNVRVYRQLAEADAKLNVILERLERLESNRGAAPAGGAGD